MQGKHFFLLIIVFLFVSTVSCGVFLSWKAWQVRKMTQKTFTPQESNFELQPPKAAVEGKVLELHGHVEKQARRENEYKVLDTTVPLEEGDVVTTQNGTVRIGFDQLVDFVLSESTHVSLSGLQPANFLLRQTRGEVMYEVKSVENKVSVRIDQVLTTLHQGTTTISYSPEQKNVKIQVASGSAEVGMVDKHNETKVWKVFAKQTAEIDTDELTVEVQ